MGNRYGNVKRGYAFDLSHSIYFASGWERDTARFLTLLQGWGVIEGWEYEPQEFSFQGLGYKRGPFTYKPDFALQYSSKIPKRTLKALDFLDEIHTGRTVFWEVKGQETGKDRSKWRRFRTHTQYPLEVINRSKLISIQTLFKELIPAWESNVY